MAYWSMAIDIGWRFIFFFPPPPSSVCHLVATAMGGVWESDDRGGGGKSPGLTLIYDPSLKKIGATIMWCGRAANTGPAAIDVAVNAPFIRSRSRYAKVYVSIISGDSAKEPFKLTF